MRSANPECRDCALSSSCKTVCMAPSLGGHLRFAVIGEAPGAEEDEQGMPFVGAAGRLLWSELKERGLSRDEAYVTNVVKCRPPENRTPKRSEISACAPYLREELRWLRYEAKVKIILALGATAYHALGGKGGITDAAGVAYEYEGLTVLPALHPAAALRSPQQMEAFKQQLTLFAQLVRGGGNPGGGLETETVLVNDDRTLAHMVADLEGCDPVAFDLETVGLDPQAERAAIICASLSGYPGRSYVVLWDHPERKTDKQKTKEALDHLFSLNKAWVAQNGRFDRKWLRAQGFTAPALRLDTIIMAHLLDENASHGVDAIAARYLGVPGWKHLMEEPFRAIQKALDKNQSIPWPPLEKLVPYAGRDADIELRLAYALWPKLSKQEKRLHDFLLAVSRVLEDVETYGVYMDGKDLDVAETKAEETAEQAVQQFAKVAGLTPGECKLNSWQWLSKILFDKLNLPIVELTDSGSAATGEHTLKRLRPYAPDLINALLEYRKQSKFLGSYLRPWRSLLNSKSRLRSSYNLTGTVTGRLACTNIIRRGMSLHQVPRDAGIRTVVSAPPGRMLIVADYSQLELRIAAAIAGEERMLQAYRNKEDLHKLTAATVLKKPLDQVTKEDRQKAKAVNFGFLYGMGAKKFVRYAFDEYDMPFTLQEAEEIRMAFFNLYRGLRPWHKRTEEFVLRHGFVRSPLGRTRHLPDVYSSDKYMQSEAIRQAINFPVQSTASDLTLAAMVLIHRYLQRTDPNQWVIGQVHDSILLEVDEDQAEELAQKLQAIMSEDTPIHVEERLGWHCPVPLAAEVQIAKCWGKPQKTIDNSR